MNKLTWHDMQEMSSHGFKCGYCNRSIASNKGWLAGDPAFGLAGIGGYIYICHHCTRPTFFDLQQRRQFPASSLGTPVKDVTDHSVAQLYDEARSAAGAGAFTAAALCCRKLLMHIAVSKGAAAGESFKSYVGFLRDGHYIPPDAEGWVDEIRQRGNEANHEILIAKREEVEELIEFCGMLLKIVFEFPAAAKRKKTKKKTKKKRTA